MGVNCMSGCVLARAGQGGEGAGKQTDSGKSKLRERRGVSEKEVVVGFSEGLTLSIKEEDTKLRYYHLKFSKSNDEEMRVWVEFLLQHGSTKLFRCLSEAVFPWS